MKRKFISIVLNMIIIIPLIAIGLNIISSNAEAESSCSAPLNNDWDISKSVQVHSVNLNSDNVKLTPLTKGFSKEFKIEDDSSTAMSMELIAGYRYNFCISLNPTLEGSSTMTNSTGDVYLMTGSNWDIYRGQYTLRDNDFVDDIEQWLPVEWKDMSTWLPFRDVHAYENIEYVYLYNEEFSSLFIAILRAISAIPLHASCGVIMGYYIGLYVFKGDKKYIVQALLIPIFIHALYNYLTGFSGLIFFGYLILVIYFAKSLHNRFIAEQQFKTIEKETKLS